MKFLRVSCCSECPFHSTARDYTEDSFETLFKWYCGKLHKHVRNYVEWNDKEKFIPEACPLEDLKE